MLSLSPPLDPSCCLREDKRTPVLVAKPAEAATLATTTAKYRESCSTQEAKAQQADARGASERLRAVHEAAAAAGEELAARRRELQELGAELAARQADLLRCASTLMSCDGADCPRLS